MSSKECINDIMMMFDVTEDEAYKILAESFNATNPDDLQLEALPVEILQSFIFPELSFKEKLSLCQSDPGLRNMCGRYAKYIFQGNGEELSKYIKYFIEKGDIEAAKYFIKLNGNMNYYNFDIVLKIYNLELIDYLFNEIVDENDLDDQWILEIFHDTLLEAPNMYEIAEHLYTTNQRFREVMDASVSEIFTQATDGFDDEDWGESMFQIATFILDIGYTPTYKELKSFAQDLFSSREEYSKKIFFRVLNDTDLSLIHISEPTRRS